MDNVLDAAGYAWRFSRNARIGELGGWNWLWGGRRPMIERTMAEQVSRIQGKAIYKYFRRCKYIQGWTK